MPDLSVARLAGAACLAVFGFCGADPVRAADTASIPHFMSVDLPDGGIARITYFGNVPPHIVVDPQASAYGGPSDVAAPGDAVADPFLAMGRMAAMLDAETSAMMRHVAMMAAAPMPGPGELIEANTGDAPAGSVSTTYVASFGGNGVCTQSVQVVSQGPGLRPRVVSQSSGECGAPSPMLRAPMRARIYEPQLAPAARMVRVRAESPHGTQPYTGMIRPAVIYTPAN